MLETKQLYHKTLLIRRFGAPIKIAFAVSGCGLQECFLIDSSLNKVCKNRRFTFIKN